MGYVRFCKCCLNSRCVFEGTYRNLPCNQVLSNNDYPFYDEYDRFDNLAEWRMIEKMEKQGRRKKGDKRFS